jgi:hypothetical protein
MSDSGPAVTNQEELALLVAYWGLQTSELWQPGVPTGPDREQRTATAKHVWVATTRIGRPDRTGSGSRGIPDADGESDLQVTDHFEPGGTRSEPSGQQLELAVMVRGPSLRRKCCSSSACHLDYTVERSIVLRSTSGR